MCEKDIIFGDTELFKYLKDVQDFAPLGSFTKDGTSIVFPKQFSFISNPIESLKCIRKIFRLTKLDLEQITLDFSKCEAIDICAFSVLSVFCINSIMARNGASTELDFSNKLSSKDPKLYEFLQKSELTKNNILSNKQPIVDYNYGKITYLMGGGSSLEKSAPCFNYTSSQASTKIFEFINASLKDLNYELTVKGEKLLSTIVGEIIDNSELHSGKFCQWFTKAQFEKNNENSYMNITVFNFGKTIYSNMKSISPDSDIYRWMHTKKRLHKNRGYYRDGHWHQKNLFTFLALQDGISHKYNKTNGLDRGTGTIRFLDCFQKLANETNHQSEICIFSGHSHVRIPSKYQLVEKVENGKNTQVLALNEQGSLSEKPDYEYLQQFNRTNFFPGTLFSIKLQLKSNFIKKSDD